MRLLLLTALASIATASAAAPVAPSKPQAPKAPTAASCQRTTSYHAVLRSGPPQKLTELPPANLYAAVYRRINGCEVPLIVRYNVKGRR